MDEPVLRRTSSAAQSAATIEPLQRDRLLALDRGQTVLVAEAPSGYGKTVLARSWLQRAAGADLRRWVSLDASARDPAVFLERLRMAIRGDAPAPPEAALDEESDGAARFARLSTQLASLHSPLRLVLDDVHHLVGSPSQPYLRRLLLGTSPEFRIFLTLQPVTAELGLGELTASGRVCWFSDAALALSRAEFEALAAQRGHGLSAASLDRLMDVTTGWPALAQMVLAMPLDGESLDLGRVAGLGPVREYVYERFLSRLDPGARELLWTLACLGSGPVRLLQELNREQAGLVTILPRLQALGIVQPEEPAAEPSLRLHPLVRESVLRLWGAEPTQPRRAVLARAAVWYSQHEQIAAAVSALIEAGPGFLDEARARLLELAPQLIFRSGQHQTLLDLIGRWEKAAGTSDPDLDRKAAWALNFQRRFGAVHERLRRAEGEGQMPGAGDESQLLGALMSALRDDYRSGGELAHRWLQAQPREPSFHTGAALTIYAYQLKCEGDIPGTLSALRRAHAAFDQVQSIYGTVWVCIVGALAQVRLGLYRDALAEIDQGLRRCGNSGAFGGQRSMLRAVEAFIRYERNELSAARDALDEALPLLAEQGLVDTLVLGFTAAARLHASSGNLGAALDLLSEAERAGQERRFRRLGSGLRAERALLLARQGAWSQARQATDYARHGTHEAEQEGAPERAARLRARLAIAEGDSVLARQVLVPVLDQARAAHQLFKQCELLLLLALIEDLAGNETAAFVALAEAMTLARAESYHRALIDEGAELQGLIRRWVEAATGRPRNDATWALDLFASLEAPVRVAATQTLVEALNAREQQILGLLAEGLSNAQIAARCFVVEGTIKWHLHNLYGKLGVRSRTAALRTARELGLLRS